MLHIGSLEIPTPVFILVISFLIGAIQFFLCYKVNAGKLRWIPTLLLALSTAVSAALIPFLDGWDRLGVILIAICCAFAALISIMGGLLGKRFSQNKI